MVEIERIGKSELFVKIALALFPKPSCVAGGLPLSFVFLSNAIQMNRISLARRATLVPTGCAVGSAQDPACWKPKHRGAD